MTALPEQLLSLPPAEVEELACRAHLGVWTARRRKLPMAPFHWEWCELAMRERRLAIVAPRDHSKALALDTPVMVPGGWKALEDVGVGDLVVGADGSATSVTGLSDTFTDHDCYRLVLDDGQSFVADAGHRWRTYYAWRGHRDVTTEEIAADVAVKNRRGQTHCLDLVRVQSDDVYLPVDPWCLGYWLGDGNTHQAVVTTRDPEVPEWFRAAGYAAVNGGKSIQWSLRDLRYSLRKIGVLGSKHVPEPYLWAGTQQRLDLLRGLMDSDGTCNHGQCVFTSKLEVLRDGVARLVSSLGWKPKKYQARALFAGRDYGPVYGVCFYPDEPVFRLERKIARQRHLPEGRRSKAVSRSVVSCEQTLTVPVRCLTTQAGSFLIGDEVPTLNSETFSVNATTWRSQYQIGVWTYIFMQTGDQAKEMITRIVSAMEETCPQLVDPPRRRTANDILFQNGSRVTSGGAGKAVRGAHPDFIVGDDVLEEATCAMELQRKRVDRWWKGTVANMAHPGSVRAVRMDPHSEPVRVVMPPTRVFLVGTPFHEQDLLLGMRSNPLYAYRRYAAEFRPEDLVPGTWAVEVS